MARNYVHYFKNLSNSSTNPISIPEELISLITSGISFKFLFVPFFVVSRLRS